MESNDENPRLVDLLYDDEIDEETAGELRAEIEETPQERAELEGYEELLSRIRREEVSEEVPSDLHDSIVSQAREAARTKQEQKARPERREPSSRDESGPGLWGRLAKGSTLSQLSIAAMALLAGGAALYMMRGNLQPPRQTDAESGAPATKTVAQEKPAEAEPSASEKATAGATESKDEPPEAAVAESEEKEVDSVKKAAGKLSDSTKSDGAPGTRSGESRQKRRRDNEGRAREQVAANDEGTSSSSSSSLDLESAPEPKGQLDSLAADKLADDRRGGSETRDSKNAKDLSVFGAQRPEAPQKKEKSKARREAREPAPSDNRNVGDLAMGGSGGSDESKAEVQKRTTSGATAEEAPPATADEAPPATEETESAGVKLAEKKAAPAQRQKPAQQQQKAEPTTTDEDKSAVPTAHDVEIAFNNGEWAKAVRRADAILRTESVDKLKKARVLELKARALEKQGLYRQARSTYAEIESNHPSYKESQIKSAKRRLNRKRADRAASKEAASETESEAESAPKKSSDEPADAVIEAY